MSLYGEYVQERTKDHIYETDTGFVTWRYPSESQVYIVDIYVKPTYRTQGVASQLADFVVECAKRRGCTELLGTVVPSMYGATTSLKVLLGYGMILSSASNDLIIMKKEI